MEGQGVANRIRSCTRRGFLKAAAGFTAAAVLTGCGQPASPTPTPAATKAPQATAASATQAPQAAAATATAVPKPATQAPAKINYPAGKPITVVVTAPAGGGTDVMVRTLQPYIEKELNTSLVIVNKGAASGQPAVTEVVKGTADGYTIGAISVPQHVQQAMDPERSPEFKVADIAWLACSVSDPCCLAVAPDAPWKDGKEFIEDAKKNPGKISIAHTGKGGDDHLHMLNVTDVTGAVFNYVQFDGGAPARTALLGGHVQGWGGNESEAVPLVKNNQIRLLWFANDKRSKYLPDVPTLKEIIGTEVIGYSQRGWFGSAKLPSEIKQLLNEVFRKVHTNPEVIAKFDSMAYPIVYKDHAEWTDGVCKEMQRIERLVKQFKVFDPIPQPCPTV